MERYHLEEDMELVKKYFPGARTTTIRTPFDFTPRDQRRLQADDDRSPEVQTGWYGDLSWNL